MGFSRSALAPSALLLALSALACSSGEASAASIAADRACYQEGEQVGFSLSGFTPDALVEVKEDGNPAGTPQVDGGGGFSGVFLPERSSVTSPVALTLSATELSNPAISAQTSYSLTDTAVRMSPSVARPSSTVTFAAHGFLTGTLYAHYTAVSPGGRHRLVKTVALGTLKGPCGSLTKRTKLLPLARPKPGSYVIQFDTLASFLLQPGSTAYVERRVRVPARRGPVR